eukprot:2961024-Lingulodinium_polyedra.AAC.1
MHRMDVSLSLARLLEGVQVATLVEDDVQLGHLRLQGTMDTEVAVAIFAESQVGELCEQLATGLHGDSRRSDSCVEEGRLALGH